MFEFVFAAIFNAFVFVLLHGALFYLFQVFLHLSIYCLLHGGIYCICNFL